MKPLRFSILLTLFVLGHALLHGQEARERPSRERPPGPVYMEIPPTKGYRVGRSTSNYPGEGEVVPILKPYHIGQGPVTNEQYMEFVGVTGHAPPPHWQGSRIPEGKEKHPVVGVSYQDAMDFCN